MERKKVLIMSDSPKLHTGFAKVAKEVWTNLNKTGKYDIKCIGWFHQDSGEEVPFPIFMTAKDEQGRITQEDKYCHKSFNSFVDKFKPDLVWTLGDMWMVDHVATCPLRKTFKWIGYFPIDGHPVPTKWGKTVEDMDIAVAYGKYGMEVIKHRAQKANLTYVYHGVDTEKYCPIPVTSSSEARKNIIGTDDGKILIGIIARNQPRKAFDKLFEAYYYLLSGSYSECDDCGKVSTWEYNLLNHKATPVKECAHCHGVNIKDGEARDDIRLYIHGAVVDCGWDLLDLQKDYDISGKVLVNPALKIGMGLSEHTLNGIYNAIDIFTLPTRGEGFGLPILEAMSAGRPVVVTDYSAHPEWSKGCGILVPPVTLEAEPLTNIRRAVIDTNLYVGALLELVNNKELREQYGKKGREVALSMDWKIIGKQWEGIVDSVLYPDGNAPQAIDPVDLKYTLEVM